MRSVCVSSGMAGYGTFYENAYQHSATDTQPTDHRQRVQAAIQRFNERQDRERKDMASPKNSK